MEINRMDAYYCGACGEFHNPDEQCPEPSSRKKLSEEELRKIMQEVKKRKKKNKLITDCLKLSLRGAKRQSNLGESAKIMRLPRTFGRLQ
ncbi:hypothetical protein COZ73_03625 [Candidatus Falkowbacteria bacterium CG_4_8_14_3_um_filter_36_11]|nr:MAG: hypothetical protein COZ73_03625 [Candidatus Falkowbacteria bacterium CG_4_8_14_3_um_filter_36_11]